MENPDTKNTTEPDVFDTATFAEAMRNGEAPGQNGDSLNQLPAAAQTNVTALDVDPQRVGDNREGADDPSQTPEVKRDLTDVTPAPAPVDAPTANVGHDPSLQQPSEAEADASKAAQEDGKKGDAPADKDEGADPVTAPNASEAKPIEAAAPVNGQVGQVMPDTAASGAVDLDEPATADDKPVTFDPTQPLGEHEQRLASLDEAGLGETPVRNTPDVSAKLQATDNAAAAEADKTDKPTAVPEGSLPDDYPPSFTAAKDEVVFPERQFTLPGQDAEVLSTKFYPSSDDRRITDASPTESTTGSVAGGAFRAKYRALSDAEKDLVNRVKLAGEELFKLMAEAGGTDPSSDRLGSANLTLGFRALEDAVMRTVKHITA